MNQKTLNPQQVLSELENEIDKMLYFFIETDLFIHGHITTGTVECFEVQKVTFPDKLKQFVQ